MSPAGTQRRGNWQASVKRHNGMAIASPFSRAMPRSLVDPDRPAVFASGIWVMALIVSAFVLSLSFLVLAAICHMYRSLLRFPSLAGGRYSDIAAVFVTCLFGQGIAMSVANASAAAWWSHALAVGMVLTAAVAAYRITRSSKLATTLPEFEPFRPVTPEGPAPMASNSNKRKGRKRRAA